MSNPTAEKRLTLSDVLRRCGCPDCRQEHEAAASRLLFLEARLGTILNMAEGELTARTQQRIAALAREALYE